MAGIDASIALNANRPAFPTYNALTAYGQVAQTGNALMQARSRQLQLAGQTALQHAYQGVGVDPDTGLPNMRAVVANLQHDPNGGIVLPQVIQSLQEQQQRQYGLNKAQQEQTTARTNTVNSALNPLLRLGGNVTPQDIFSTMAGLHASGFNTDEAVNDAATTLPTRQPGQSAAAYGQQLQGWVVNHASRSWGADTQAGNFTPKPGTLETGGQIITRDTNPYTNPGITSAAPISRTFTPGEQASQVKGPVGPNGQPTVQTQAGYAQQNGMGQLVPGGSSSPLGTGRLPAALMNPNRPGGAPPAATPGYAPAAPPSAAPAAAPAIRQQIPIGHADQMFPPSPAMSGQSGGYVPASAPGGYAPPSPMASQPPGAAPAAMPVGGSPMAVGLGPGQTAGITTAGDASAHQWASLQSSVGGSAGRIYQLKSALGDLQALGPNGTGPSSGMVNNVKSYLQSLPIVGQSLGIDPAQVADYDQANKYLTAYAAARAGAHGGGTDQQLATTLSSNASTHISNLAAQNVVRANIGLERMDQAQIASFQKGLDPATGQPTGQQFTPDQFADYAARWNTAQDPRAFVADHLTPAQFDATVSGMQPAEQAKFRSTFNTALSNGWIDPPAWLQSQGQGQPAAGATPAAAAPSAPQPAAAPSDATTAPAVRLN